MSKSEKSKWIIGLSISVCIAIVGWLFGVLQTANAENHDYIIQRVDKSDAATNLFVQEFKSAIVRIETNQKRDNDILQAILKRLGAE